VVVVVGLGRPTITPAPDSRPPLGKLASGCAWRDLPSPRAVAKERHLPLPGCVLPTPTCASLVVADRLPKRAVTLALCGQWVHDGPCPLAPHHTSTERRGALLDLRVVFVSEAHTDVDLRERIVAALSAGQAEALDLGSSGTCFPKAVGTPTAAEAALAARWVTAQVLVGRRHPRPRAISTCYRWCTCAFAAADEVIAPTPA
jgi:hypothetical protein